MPPCALQLFFAKVLRTASEEEVRNLFRRFGHVCEVNLFRAFQVGFLPGLLEWRDKAADSQLNVKEHAARVKGEWRSLRAATSY